MRQFLNTIVKLLLGISTCCSDLLCQIIGIILYPPSTRTSVFLCKCYNWVVVYDFWVRHGSLYLLRKLLEICEKTAKSVILSYLSELATNSKLTILFSTYSIFEIYKPRLLFLWPIRYSWIKLNLTHLLHNTILIAKLMVSTV